MNWVMRRTASDEYGIMRESSEGSDTEARKKTMTKKLVLRPSEAFKILGVGNTAGYAAIKNGEIPSIKINGRIYIPTKKLCELIGADPSDLEGLI